MAHDDGSGATTQPYGPHDTTQLTDGMNRYGQVDGAPLSYDARGNTLADGLTDNDYGYDIFNRQTGMENAGHEAEYVYDAMGRRIAAVITTTGGVTTTHFIYDSRFRVVEERNSESVWVARYTYGEGVDEVLLMERGGNDYYLHRDALGSITEVTDGSGTLVERYEYDVYGKPLFFDGSYNAISESAIGNPYLFTGRRYDAESGNYYYRARMYSPGLGRFLSMDPLGFGAGDANLYRYVFNNPANFVDPMGEIPLLATAAIGGGINLLADYLITRYIEKVDYTWQRGLVAFGTGALAGMTGAGIGAVAANVSSGLVAFVIRVGGNAAANVGINALQRYLNDECTLPENLLIDALIGAAAGGLDQAFSHIINQARPHINPVKIIRNVRFGMVDSGKWAGRQGETIFREGLPAAVRYWEASMSGLAVGLSNTSFINLVATFIREASEAIDWWMSDSFRLDYAEQ